MDNRYLQDGAVDTAELLDGLLAASAAGRGKMAAGFFDQATFAAKVAAQAVGSAQVANGAVLAVHMSTPAKQSTLQSKLLAGWVQRVVAAAGGLNDDVTTDIQAAATVTTPTQDGAVKGIMSTGAALADTLGTAVQNYKVQIRDSVTKQPLNDGAGGEVYGVLSFATAVWTLTYYTAVGVAIAIPAASIDILFAEVFDADSLPLKAMLLGATFGDISDIAASHTHPLAQITDVTATAAEVNQVNGGVSANVTAANLGALTGGLDTALHTHDARYFTEIELLAIGTATNPNTTSGAAKIGTDATAIGANAGTTDTVQGVLEAFSTAIAAAGGTPVSGEVINLALEAGDVVTDLALTDTINNTPVAGSFKLYLNQIRMLEGAHFTRAGTIITWLGATSGFSIIKATDKMTVDYTF